MMFPVVIMSCFEEVSYQVSKLLDIECALPWCASHTSCNFLVTSTALTCALITVSLVSSGKTKYLPAPHFEVFITHTGKLVTATVTADLSHCKVEAYFEDLDLFSESREGDIVWGCIKSGFLLDFPFSFAESLFLMQAQTSLLWQSRFSGFSSMVTLMRRHFTALT